MDFLRALDPRRALLIVGTLLAAFFSGHVMQSGFFEDEAIRDPGLDAAPVLKETSRTPSLPVPPAATLTPLDLPPPPPQIEANDALIDSSFPADGAFSPYGLPCTVTLALVPAPDASLGVRLSAPCRADAPVRLRHEALEVRGLTDAFGRMSLTLPAMAYTARVEAAFEDGEVVQAVRVVPLAEDVRRVALLWSGPQVLRLRAEGGDGVVTSLDGAEVFTLPARPALATGVVRLALEARVTAESCGGFVRARTVQAGAIGGAMVRDVSLQMPDCDRIGEVTRFEGVFRDLRVAHR